MQSSLHFESISGVLSLAISIKTIGLQKTSYIGLLGVNRLWGETNCQSSEGKMTRWERLGRGGGGGGGGGRKCPGFPF